MADALARITCYNDLVAALRARKEGLGLSDETVDALANLHKGHTSKVLAPAPQRGIGASTFEGLMIALAFDLLMVESATKLKAIQESPDYTQRAETHVRTFHRLGDKRFSRAMSELRAKGVALMRADGSLASRMQELGKRRWIGSTATQRREFARSGAKKRWSNYEQKKNDADADRVAEGSP